MSPEQESQLKGHAVIRRNCSFGRALLRWDIRMDVQAGLWIANPYVGILIALHLHLHLHLHTHHPRPRPLACHTAAHARSRPRTAAWVPAAARSCPQLPNSYPQLPYSCIAHAIAIDLPNQFLAPQLNPVGTRALPCFWSVGFNLARWSWMSYSLLRLFAFFPDTQKKLHWGLATTLCSTWNVTPCLGRSRGVGLGLSML